MQEQEHEQRLKLSRQCQHSGTSASSGHELSAGGSKPAEQYRPRKGSASHCAHNRHCPRRGLSCEDWTPSNERSEECRTRTISGSGLKGLSNEVAEEAAISASPDDAVDECLESETVTVGDALVERLSDKAGVSAEISTRNSSDSAETNRGGEERNASDSEGQGNQPTQSTGSTEDDASSPRPADVYPENVCVAEEIHLEEFHVMKVSGATAAVGKSRLRSSQEMSSREDRMDFFSDKRGRRRKNRTQRSQRKWKQLPSEIEVNFKSSIFPRQVRNDGRAAWDVTEAEEEIIFQRELEEFNRLLESCEEGQGKIDSDSDESNPIVEESTANRAESVPTEESSGNGNRVDDRLQQLHPCPVHTGGSLRTRGRHSLRKQRSTAVQSSFDDDFSDLHYRHLSWNDTSSKSILVSLDYSTLLLTNRRLRNKKKWRETKARIQIKSKHCRSVSNSVHGQTFYINHRVVKRMSMVIEPKRYVAPVSLKRIDASKGLPTGGLSSVDKSRKPKNISVVPPSVWEVDPFCVDQDIPGDLVNALMTLQHRDLSPEDYELLLRLDDRVKPKTVDASILTDLKTDVVTSADCGGPGGDGRSTTAEVCAVCLEPYEIGQTRKYLPCQHCFHASCIDSWLSNSSLCCPLDATPVV